MDSDINDARLYALKGGGSRGNANLELPFFMLGLGAGVALTLLFAPVSGGATRRRIGRRVKDGENWVKDQAASAMDRMAATAEGVREKAKEIAEVVSAR